MTDHEHEWWAKYVTVGSEVVDDGAACTCGAQMTEAEVVALHMKTIEATIDAQEQA